MSALQVALLHGLHASPGQLEPLWAHLRRRGHRPVRFDVTTRHGIDACIAQARSQLDAAFPHGDVAIVGFSFGSLVGRGLAHHLGERCPMLVQVAPPNRGAAWAKRLSGVGRVSLGVRDLHPGSAALVALPVPACPIAVVAGSEKIRVTEPLTWAAGLGSMLLELAEPGDGTVTLAETELPTGRETERLTLPYAHDHLPRVAELHLQVAHFLEQGRFRR